MLGYAVSLSSFLKKKSSWLKGDLGFGLPHHVSWVTGLQGSCCCCSRWDSLIELRWHGGRGHGTQGQGQSWALGGDWGRRPSHYCLPLQTGFTPSLSTDCHHPQLTGRRTAIPELSRLHVIALEISKTCHVFPNSTFKFPERRSWLFPLRSVFTSDLASSVQSTCLCLCVKGSPPRRSVWAGQL